jgi:hypothetical protein
MKKCLSTVGAFAILATSAVLSTAAFAQVAPGVTGPNVHYVKCGESQQGGQVQYADSGNKAWTYLDQNGYSGTAKEVNRDQWSVLLVDDQDAEVTLNMWEKTCTWNKAGNVRSYKVLDAQTLTP